MFHFIYRKFYEKFGSPGTISLAENKYPTACQKFLNKYKEMEKDFTDENDLFDAVAKAIEEEKLAVEASEPSENTSSMASMLNSALKNPQNSPQKFSVQDVLKDK